MIRIPKPVGVPLSWTAGVWVVAGTQLLVMYYLVLVSPKFTSMELLVPREFSEAVTELARVMIVVNWMIILGLGLWTTQVAGEGRRSRLQRMAALAAAITLLAVSFAWLDLGRNPARSGVQVDAVWQPSDSVFGSVRLSPPLAELPE